MPSSSIDASGIVFEITLGPGKLENSRLRRHLEITSEDYSFPLQLDAPTDVAMGDRKGPTALVKLDIHNITCPHDVDVGVQLCPQVL